MASIQTPFGSCNGGAPMALVVIGLEFSHESTQRVITELDRCLACALHVGFGRMLQRFDHRAFG